MVNNTWKFDCRLSTPLHDDLHWLDVPIDILLSPWPCLFFNHLTPAYDVAVHLCLRSAIRHQLIGLFRSLVRWSGTLFPMYSEIRNMAMTAINRHYFSVYINVTSALEVFLKQNVLYKSTFYLLTFTYYSGCNINHFSVQHFHHS